MEDKNVKDFSVSQLGENGTLLGVVDGDLHNIKPYEIEAKGEVKEGDNRAVSGDEVNNKIGYKNPYFTFNLQPYKSSTNSNNLTYFNKCVVKMELLINTKGDFKKENGELRRIKIRSLFKNPTTNVCTLALDVEDAKGIFSNFGNASTLENENSLVIYKNGIYFKIELNKDLIADVTGVDTVATFENAGLDPEFVRSAVKYVPNIRYVGQSIWWYNGQILSGTAIKAIGYQYYIERSFEFLSISNYCYSGNSLGALSEDDSSSIVNKMDDWQGSINDLFTLDTITNDFKRNIPIGVLDDYISNTGKLTYYGALRLFREKVAQLTNNTYTVVASNSLKRNHDGYTSTSKNTVGHTLQDYETALYTVANRDNWYIVDQNRQSGITDETIFQTTIDGLHLNNLGYRLASKCWIDQLRIILNQNK